MKSKLQTYLILASIFFLFGNYVKGQTHSHNEETDHHVHKTSSLQFVPNQKQWHPNVRFKANYGGTNTVFLEDQSFTWMFHDANAVEAFHQNHGSLEEQEKQYINGHAYKVHFIGAGQPSLSGREEQNYYHNYFLDNDPDHWAGKVPIFHSVVYDNLYEGIQLEAYSLDGLFKYDFVVAPGYDPDIIQLEYEGTDGLSIRDGNLIVQTSVGEIQEQQPYSFQIINGKEIPITCSYRLNNNRISFHFPEGYNKDYPLVVDPVVIASTLSGTIGTANFGHTATFDFAGNIYAGGIAFGPNYPTTTGAFQSNFAGGAVDIAVSKYNPDGTNLIYATYIGGSEADYPHSMIVDFNGQLCIYGSSNSFNYPTTSNSVQPNRGGNFDIVITKLNMDGTALVGSTYMGGSNTDGRNNSAPNYGDDFRGEIVLDQQGNIFVSSSSSSTNFPVTSNAFQTTNAGNQDVVLMKLNSDLSTLFWATYLGSSENDTGLGMKVDASGNVFSTGMAGSGSFPMAPGGFQSTWPGGNNNGFVVKLSPFGNELLQSTFFGSSDGDDFSYLLDIDEDKNVHIFGQTTGTIDITADTYFFNAGSRQFFAGFSPNLSSLVYSTVIGTGNSFGFDFVPVAFMVDKCNGIYFSGYYAVGGLPTTADAIETGSDKLYLAQLTPNATALNFGTYYGNANHVDGGTSRFDKAGIVYQAVCSCSYSFDPTVLNTLPNAWATTQSAEVCDIGVFKIDFEIQTVTAAAYAEPSTSGCAPFTVDFKYSGQDAETFFWDFGTGDTSTEEHPSYTFLEPGTYNVMQIANAPSTCNVADTFYLKIHILNNTSTLTDTTFCSGSVDLFLGVAIANASYEWQDGSYGASYQVNQAGTYWVDVNIGDCTRRDSFVVTSTSTVDVDLGTDVTFCDITNFDLDASHPLADSYLWNTGATTSNITATTSGDYWVAINDIFGCQISDTINLTLGQTPTINLGPDTTLCSGDIYTLNALLPDATYIWQDGSTESIFNVTEEGLFAVEVNSNGCLAKDSLFVSYVDIPSAVFSASDVLCNGESTGSIEAIFSTSSSSLGFNWSNNSTTADLINLPAGAYLVTITNEFGCTFETEVIVNQPPPLALSTRVQDVQCNGDRDGWLVIDSTGGGVPPYLYRLRQDSFSNNSIFNFLDGGTYDITVLDANGCTSTETAIVYEPPLVILSAGEDKHIQLGDSVLIEAVLVPAQNQAFRWTFEEELSCSDCIRPYASPMVTTPFTITSVDSITGCTLNDVVQIIVEKPRSVFIPNAFSPNSDGVNDLFYLHGDISVRQVNYFRVFDRWGEMVYAAEDFPINDPNFGWDGLLNGKYMNPGVFVYIAEIEFVDGFVEMFTGDVALFR